MSARRLRAIFRRVVQEIRRDRPSLALLFMAPILMTGLVTFIVRESQTPNVSVVIADGGSTGGPLAAAALQVALGGHGLTVTRAADADAARRAVADGTVDVAIVLPSDLGSEMETITLITNGMDPAAEGSRLAAVQQAIVGSAAAIIGETLPDVQHTTIYGVPTNDPIGPFAPAIVGFLAYFFVYILTGVSFLRERTGGTLERLMATPVTRGEIVGGYTLGFGLFATIQVAVILLWTLGTVHVPAIGPLPGFAIGLGVAIAGNALAAFVVVLLLAGGAVSLGIFLSTFARTELQVIQFIPIVLAPQFLLSGVLFPVTSLPDVLQPFVRIMPVTYAVDGLREVFIRGADLASSALLGDLAVLALIALFFATIASLTIRRDVA